MDELKYCRLILISLLIVTGCENKPATPVNKENAPALTSSENKPPVKKEPSPEELKQQEIDVAFKEFMAAQQEPDPDKWKERYDAAFKAITGYGKDAIPVLINGLKDKKQIVRESASDVLAAIGPSTPDETNQFLEFLKDESEVVRVNLVSCLCLVPEHQGIAIKELKTLLKSKDPVIQSTASGSAATLDDKAVALVDELLLVVADSSTQAKNLALEALGRVETFSEEQKKKIQELIDVKDQDPAIIEKLKPLLEKK